MTGFFLSVFKHRLLSQSLWTPLGMLWSSLTSWPYNYVVCWKQGREPGNCRHVCQQMSKNVSSLAFMHWERLWWKRNTYIPIYTCIHRWPLWCCQGSRAYCDLLCGCQSPHFQGLGDRRKFRTQMQPKSALWNLSKMHLFSAFLCLSRFSGNFQLLLFIYSHSVFYHFEVSPNHQATAQHNIAVAWTVTSSKMIDHLNGPVTFRNKDYISTHCFL